MQIPTVSVFLNISKTLGGKRMHVEGFESVLMEGLCTTGYLDLKVFQGYFYLNLYFIQNTKKTGHVV